MATVLRLRSIQLWLGLAYLAVAGAALVRDHAPAELAIAIAMTAGAFLTGRTLPDALIPAGQRSRVAGVGMIVLTVGLIAESRGATTFAVVVMAYCAGNRLRAAGVGKAA